MKHDKIIIKGAREHNLKNVNLEIPRDKMVVFTGLSGSGKSSLAFDTIFAEGQRRYIESLSAYARQFLGRLDKPDVDDIEGLSPAISIDQKSHSGNPRSTVATITEIYDYLRVLFARAGTPYCPTCGREIKKLTNEEIVDVAIDISDSNKDKKNFVILAPVVRGRKGEYYQMLYDFLNAGFSEVRIDGKYHSLRDRVELSRYKTHDIDLVVDRLPSGMNFKDKDNRLRLAEAIESGLKYGNAVVTLITDKEVSLSAKFTCPHDGFSFPEIEPRLFSFNSPYGACPECHGLGTKDLWSEEICPVCDGKRLRVESLNVLVDDKNITTVTALSIEDAHAFFSGLKFKATSMNEVAEAPLREIKNRLKFMMDVGLEYLTLDRKAGTLSGGEAQRIRLASQIGSRLVGTLYILDEPTIGLHQRDNAKLIQTLKDLRDLGNTIVVVEHDEDTIRESDYLVDIGPGAGVHGGNVVAQGPMPELIKDMKQNSLTLQYLRGKKFIEVPETRRKVTLPAERGVKSTKIKLGGNGGTQQEFLKIRGAHANNLKDVDVDIPLRRFTAVTGVSGSGKSSLVYDVLYKAVADKLNHASFKAGGYKSLLGWNTSTASSISIRRRSAARRARIRPRMWVHGRTSAICFGHGGRARARLQAGPVQLQRSGRPL